MKKSLLGFLFFLLSFLSITNIILGRMICLDEQSSFLLQFKHSFSFDNISPECYPKVESWKVGTDCCSWDGVTCDMHNAGYVIGLDLSATCLHGPLHANNTLFRLFHLQKLNLASNDFNYSQIPSAVGKLTRLTHLNLSSSSFSGQIPSEILQLTRLNSLDFSNNGNFDLRLEKFTLRILIQHLSSLRELHFNGVNISSRIPETLGNLYSLTSLKLQDCGLYGEFPVNIFHLPNLQILDLHGNSDVTGYFPDFQSHNSSLGILNLGSCLFSGPIPFSLGNLLQLTYLDLSANKFSGQVPTLLGNLSQLTYLDLSGNNFSGKIPNSLGNLIQLTQLKLSINNFSGQIPPSIGNLTQLTYLDISINSFNGQIPSSFGNLSQLTILELSNNNLNDGQSLSSLGNLIHLTELHLSSNNFNGSIPSSLFMLPSLTVLDLDRNRFTGGFNKLENISTSLQYLYLGYNELDGPFPRSITKFTNLIILHLSSNKLNGTVEFGMFEILNQLNDLDISHNNLSLTTQDKNNYTSLVFTSLGLASCNLTKFPIFLRKQESLLMLDLSNNKIGGSIPKWIWNIGKDTLALLDLSHNLLEGFEEPRSILPWSQLTILDLHSNYLQGPLPIPAPSIKTFVVSENKFSGDLPPSICELDTLFVLDLSNNTLGGLIPQCLGHFSEFLSVLKLRQNNFHGPIPQTFINGSFLRTLDLNNNHFEGKIPKSLAGCKMLEVLDLGNNQMEDEFPFWVGNLPELRVLILRANKFHGSIVRPRSGSPFSNILIFDVSYNNFIGKLSSQFFSSWKAMMDTNDGSKYVGNELYQDSVIVMNKGQKMAFGKILMIFKAIDLSVNKFEGEIPESIGNLKSLIVLNLSHNSFTKHIPSSFGNLIQLESLDISNNKLNGEIPSQLSHLTFLAVINFSWNLLIGPIPQGKQFETFSNSSFVGNEGLCGSPLSKKCNNFEGANIGDTEASSKNSTSELDWAIILSGYGSGVVIGVSLGFVIYSREHEWFERIVERGRLIVRKGKSQRREVAGKKTTQGR